MQASVIDAFSFCQLKEQRSASTAIKELPRLLAECANDQGALDWSLSGGSDQHGLPQMHLSVSGKINLVCQRCLTAYTYDLDSSSELILAKDEDHADEIEVMLDDDEIDVVVGSKTLNIMDLIEDEALLAIPQSPKHAVCPDVVAGLAPTSDTLTAAIDAEAIKSKSPFAVLKKVNGRT